MKQDRYNVFWLAMCCGLCALVIWAVKRLERAILCERNIRVREMEIGK